MNPKDEEESFFELELSPVPRPLEINTVPPFLSKTFDIVDDSAIDAIVSWSSAGASFVVWDPVEFSRLVLPRSFKHNNFSSFVRQLNTYKNGGRKRDDKPSISVLGITSTSLPGFRKVDTDRWEFANEAFLRGNKHLLKNIQRRRPTQPQQVSPETAALSPELGMEVEKLRWERTALMQEVVELQYQQRGTARLVDGVNRRLRSAEQKQKQMVSFFSKMVQNPDFVAKLEQKSKRKNIASSQRPRRKFVTHQLQHQQLEISELEVSHEGQLTVESDDGESGEFQQDDEPTVQDDTGLDKGKGIMIPLEQEFNIGFDPEYCLSFLDHNLTGQRAFPVLSSATMENAMIKEENIWDLGLDSAAGMSSVGNEFLGDQVSYEGVDLEMMSEMLDIWDFGSSQVGGGSSETDKWPSDGLSCGNRT